MPPDYPTPETLLAALRERDPVARARFRAWVREPLDHLVLRLRDRHGLTADAAQLAAHARAAAEAFARTRPPEEFDGAGWDSFLCSVLVHVACVLLEPFEAGPRPSLAPAPLPETDAYRVRTYFAPVAPTVGVACGGDWFGGRRSDDGSLWLIVADVSGHGYLARLLAANLPDVWHICWETRPEQPSPCELLTGMHDLLAECLPDGVFVECTLARLRPDGAVTVAPAGSRLLVRSATGGTIVHRLCGGLLGVLPPDESDQREFHLAAGDELLLATDGLFDQLLPAGMARLVGAGPGCPLFDALEQALRESLGGGSPVDDITAVVARRRGPTPNAPEAH
jgi:hypothetical protein